MLKKERRLTKKNMEIEKIARQKASIIAKLKKRKVVILPSEHTQKIIKPPVNTLTTSTLAFIPTDTN